MTKNSFVGTQWSGAACSEAGAQGSWSCASFCDYEQYVSLKMVRHGGGMISKGLVRIMYNQDMNFSIMYMSSRS